MEHTDVENCEIMSQSVEMQKQTVGSKLCLLFSLANVGAFFDPCILPQNVYFYERKMREHLEKMLLKGKWETFPYKSVKQRGVSRVMWF